MSETGLDFRDLLQPDLAARWRDRVLRALEGRSFETLVSATAEGLPIEPLYPRGTEDRPRALRQRRGGWRIAQRMDAPEPATANRLALTDLENGAEALVIVIAGAAAARGFGLAIEGEAELDEALTGIELDLISLRVDAGARAPEIAQKCAGLARRRRLTAASLDVDFGLDPFGHFARLGGAASALASALGRIGPEAAALSKALRASGFAGRLMLADGRPYHEAGAGEAQELAALLATGLSYLRLLEAHGLALEDARDEIAFLLVADADEFLTLAKFRALRRLWARIESVCGLTPKPLRLHAETAFRMMTRYAPWVNICRTTMAAFSAGLGGADAIAVLPFTSALGRPDAFARRLARNAQLVLLLEANLAKVADPAAGAGGFEALTDSLCLRAWSLFQRIEAAGGLFASLQSRWLQTEIAAAAAERRRRIALRLAPITGVSAFPDLNEAAVSVLAPSPDVSLCAPSSGALPPSQRDSEPFEALRDAAEAFADRTGARPKLFIAGLGASSVRSFFAIAGIESVAQLEFADAHEAAEAFCSSGCKIACICASDPVPVDALVASAQALSAAGATAIYFAGLPGHREEKLRQAGVVDFFFEGCDALGLLENAMKHAAA